MKYNISNITFNNPLIRVLISLVIISISAQLTIQVGDIPITGQTLSIIVIALLLNPKETLATTVGYLILGAIGLPIFADGASGISKITGGSGGFLLGFIISSVIISYLFQSFRSRGWLTILLLTSLGTIIILICGVGRLAMLYGLDKGIEYGFTPFWKGALIKVIIGSFVTLAILHYQKQLSKKS